MQSNTLNFTISIFVTVVPSMALRNLMIMTLKRLNQGQTRLLLFQACVSIRRLSSQCFNSIGRKSSVFHQDGCLVSVLFSYFRKELAPNGAQTHSFLHDEIESSVKIAKKMMALAPVELLFYSDRESGSLFKIPFSVIIS